MHKYSIFTVFQVLQNIEFSHCTGNCTMVCSVVLAVGLNSDEWTKSGLTAACAVECDWYLRKYPRTLGPLGAPREDAAATHYTCTSIGTGAERA